MSVVMVIANHADLADQVRPFGVPFIHIPATKDIREEAERRQLELLRGNVDLVVLARYMQILTPRFLAEVDCPLINIHHSFLPAFIGAAPYRRAKERGVKLVGATAHYVTDGLRRGSRSSSRTWSGSTIATASRTSCASAPMWSGRCCPVRCSGTARTA